MFSGMTADSAERVHAATRSLTPQYGSLQSLTGLCPSPTRRAGGRPAVDRDARREEAAWRIADCDRKLNQYRAPLDAGASPTTVAGWIAETEVEMARLQASQSRADGSTVGKHSEHDH
jgi:hypothetical protein